MSFPRSRRLFFYLFIVLLPSISIYISYRAKKSKEALIKGTLPFLSKDTMPGFQLFTHTGDTITRDSLKGKIVVSDFFFTRCRGICPAMSKQMKRVQKFISENKNNSTHFLLLSHSVDPVRDSVEVLKTYAELYGADGKLWYLVTGDKQQLYKLAINFYKLPALESPEDTLSPFTHSERFTLVDKEGNIRGYYDGTDSLNVNKLMEDIAKLDLSYAMQSIRKKK